MITLFCNSYDNPNKPDEFFEDLYLVASQCHQVGLLNYDNIVNFPSGKIIISLPEMTGPAMYLGWMLRSQEYLNLYEILRDSFGIHLVNTPDQYLNTHHFNRWYNKLQELTPKSVIVAGDASFEEIYQALTVFNDQAIIVKDFVSSNKHAWADCMFIPSASNLEEIRRVVTNLKKWQPIVGGLVFRQYTPLHYIAEHSKTKLMLGNEYRYFVYKKKIISRVPYWNDFSYEGFDPPPDDTLAQEVIDRIDSNFFTIDVAETAEGHWIVMEIGAGEVSSLPESINKNEFFRRIAEIDAADTRTV